MDMQDRRSDESFSATILGEWSPWGPCSRQCGRGVRHRYFRHGRYFATCSTREEKAEKKSKSAGGAGSVGRRTLTPPDPQLKGAWFQAVSTLEPIK
jgi:hypothetical protein